MKQRSTAIDFFKLLFSICIIGVHLDLFRDISTPAYRILTQSLFRIGVPFYFIVSGYFFADKLNDSKRSNAWLLRLVKIYLTFEALDLLLTVMVPGIHLPFGMILLRVLTTGMNRIYWYLISLILTCFLLRKPWQKGYALWLTAAGFVLYVITMTFDSYSFLFADTVMAEYGKLHTFLWAWPQAGFSESVLYLSIGVFLKQKEPEIREPELLLGLSLILLVLEGWFCQSHGAADANCYFMLVPASVLLFCFTLNHPHFPRIPHAGDLSLYVYMIHMYYSFLSNIISAASLPRFLFTTALSLLSAALFVLIRSRIHSR